MTAHKFYKRGLVTAEPILAPFGDWEVREQGESGAHCYTDERFRKTYAPLPVIPQAVGEYIEWSKDNELSLVDAMRWHMMPDWALDHSDTFALAWLLGEWEVDDAQNS